MSLGEPNSVRLSFSHFSDRNGGNEHWETSIIQKHQLFIRKKRVRNFMGTAFISIPLATPMLEKNTKKKEPLLFALFSDLELERVLSILTMARVTNIKSALMDWFFL